MKFQDYFQQQGFSFIMLVTGRIHQMLNDRVQKLNKSTISTSDILNVAGKLKLKKNGDEWVLANERAKDTELLNRIGFTPLRSYP